MPNYEVIPIFRKQAQEFIRKHHRHNKPPVCDIYRIALKLDNQIVGVCVVGRPMSPSLCDGLTVEVVRLCILEDHNLRNACSMLYGRACRIAQAMGYNKIITYTLVTEKASSLKASGFQKELVSGPHTWDRPNAGRPRQMHFPEFAHLQKVRWSRILNTNTLPTQEVTDGPG